ncbi:BREX-3 system phosphatase PglZ [Fidelibacter multiformis]|uniref:BREX-3 system phosphatase PglZ n=1 Tax=Fidelibacter multiformis TaxID=3377529 RepID=UPI0037DD820F
MNNWREQILKEFTPNVARLTLVADPDSLLTEEKLSLKLRERGFDVIEYTDPVEFRYVYESTYRSAWDCGKHTDLVVILKSQVTEIESMPYDLLQIGRKLSFSLGNLFPNMSYPIISKLDRSMLDKLFEAQQRTMPDRMGDNTTKDYVLRHVFGIAPELIPREVDLLRVLLHLHYGKYHIPSILAERLIQVLKENDSFKSWPLSEIVADDTAFYDFLQERWPVFLSRLSGPNQGREAPSGYNLKYSGPDYLPFDHQDIKVYIDNLFLEGQLTPVEMPEVDSHADSWIQTGIIIPNTDDEKQRTSRLFDLVEKELPETDSRYTDWIDFALKWAELSSLVYCSNNTEHEIRLREISNTINTLFAEWLTNHYSGLINLPPTKPALLHHIPRRLARDLDLDGKDSVALIVVDGLSLDQWVTIRHLMKTQDSNLIMREHATFAWIPTLTSVSRQAIFSGKLPQYFPSSINTTNNEEKLWTQFWENQGVSRFEVVYKRSLGDGDALKTIDSLIHRGRTKVIGLVVDKVDKIIHGIQLGSAGMHNQIIQWCQKRFLVELIRQLIDLKYDVWLTSDHGNIQCEGKGRPSEGVIAETRGERTRIYPTPELRSQVARTFPFAHEWQPVGLPADFYPLVLSGNDAFVKTGDVIVGHGGISLQEVIVPLVRFERRI